MDRPNYVLNVKAACRDDYLYFDNYFYAFSDDKARETASDFIEEANRRDRQQIEEGKKRYLISKNDVACCYFKSKKIELIN